VDNFVATFYRFLYFEDVRNVGVTSFGMARGILPGPNHVYAMPARAAR
jgi:hypothetical protein